MMPLRPDLDVRLRALVDAAAEGPGALDPALRRRAARAEPLPEPLGDFAAKAARGTLGPQDVEALRRAGYDEDEVFELTVSAVLGWAKAQLDAAMRALQDAEAPLETKEEPA